MIWLGLRGKEERASRAELSWFLTRLFPAGGGFGQDSPTNANCGSSHPGPRSWGSCCSLWRWHSWLGSWQDGDRTPRLPQSGHIREETLVRQRFSRCRRRHDSVTALLRNLAPGLAAPSCTTDREQPRSFRRRIRRHFLLHLAAVLAGAEQDRFAGPCSFLAVRCLSQQRSLRLRDPLPAFLLASWQGLLAWHSRSPSYALHLQRHMMSFTC